MDFSEFLYFTEKNSVLDHVIIFYSSYIIFLKIMEAKISYTGCAKILTYSKMFIFPLIFDEIISLYVQKCATKFLTNSYMLINSHSWLGNSQSCKGKISPFFQIFFIFSE